MNIYEVFRERQSCRAYSDQPVPLEALQRIGLAVDLAPTASNLQSFEIQVILNDELRARIAEAYFRDWLKSAPAIAVAIGDRGEAWKHGDSDSMLYLEIGIVLEHFILAAQAEGLGTCWICAFHREEMDAVMGVTGTARTVVAITPVGYPIEQKTSSERLPRKPLYEIYKIIN